MEFRNGAGLLSFLIFFMPDGRACLTSSIKDPDFLDVVKNSGAKMEGPSLGKNTISIHHSPMRIAQVFEGANLVDVRDDTNSLVFIVVWMPGRAPELCDALEPRFQSLVREFDL